ncbi:pleiotropic drug resistance ABC transporter protein [Favolaschia claudopus]|uniref:Pleiotropic drug resistance ABC transporter protein n=1 Tax=Favolaschia claudopus TaxID=2862362 RepID=A0AAV9ZQS4_9AGAR
MGLFLSLLTQVAPSFVSNMASFTNYLHGGMGGEGGQSTHGGGGSGGRGEGPTINHNHLYPSATHHVNVLDLPIVTENQSRVSGLSESGLYCSEMLPQRRGFPLYQPAPYRKLPTVYRENGVSIGDVGRVNDEGIFEFFFNVFLPEDHPINANRTPNRFVPMEQYDANSMDVTDREFEHGSHVSSSNIYKETGSLSQEQFPGGKLSFSCDGIAGAVLALPRGALMQKLERTSQLRKYVTQHAEGWYVYIRDGLGLELGNGDLCLITGHEKTKSWGMASFQDNHRKIKFDIVFKPDDGDQYRWFCVPGQKDLSKRQCYDDPSGPLNHTVFLHGWSISLGQPLLGRVFGTVTVKTASIEEFKAYLAKYSGFHVASSQGWLVLEWLFGTNKRGGSSSVSQHSRNVMLNDFPANSKICNPAQLINEFMLRKYPTATVALSHDDDWCTIFENKDTAMSALDFVQQIENLFVAKHEDDAAFLCPMDLPHKDSMLLTENSQVQLNDNDPCIIKTTITDTPEDVATSSSLTLVVHKAKTIEWHPGLLHRNRPPNLYVKIYHNGHRIFKTQALRRNFSPVWDSSLDFVSRASSEILLFRLFHSSIGPDLCLGEANASVQHLIEQSSSGQGVSLDINGRNGNFQLLFSLKATIPAQQAVVQMTPSRMQFIMKTFPRYFRKMF